MKNQTEKMISASDIKKLWKKNIHENGHQIRFFLRDTSGANSYGYSYDLIKQHHISDDDGFWYWADVKKIASSETLWLPEAKNQIGDLGAFCQAFKYNEITEALA